MPTYQKRGSCIIKDIDTPTGLKTVVDEQQAFGEAKHTEIITHRTRWIIDKDIPVFRGEGMEYIDRLVYVGDKI